MHYASSDFSSSSSSDLKAAENSKRKLDWELTAETARLQIKEREG